MNSKGLQRGLALLAPLLTIIVLSGCLARYTTAGGIEPEFRPLEGKSYRTIGDAGGESSSFYFFWMIPVTPEHSLSQAIEGAIGEKGGDNMINLRWWIEKQHWILGTVNVITVEGTVIRYDE
ncbi:MAG: hypothetical protein JXA20_10825 [Spirochaetes bacterium]|nr:hypothetical protein [Spirochaetota bacterium]